MSDLVFVQGVMTSYRFPVFKDLAKLNGNGMDVIADAGGVDFGGEYKSDECLSFLEAGWVKVFGLYFLPLKRLLSLRFYKKVIHFADFKYMSLWFCLFFKSFFGVNVYLHGQGGYKKNSAISRWVYVLAVYLSDGYICYTDYSKHELLKKLPSSLHRKVYVCSNSLMLRGQSSKNEVYENDSLFYIGRLRPFSGIELLLQAASSNNVVVEVIGGGEDAYIRQLKQTFPKANFHGPVFSEQAQLDISKKCFAGCYGGDAGLSVVHYMAFGLPVIVHSSISDHMGPEPSYVKNNYNGLTFNRNDVSDLSEKINFLKNDKELQKRLSNAASETFKQLSNPSMAVQFNDIINGRG
ncbi:MAG: glycosyltransferase family 4 protein [Pseudomonadota bacterium]|nr:glycosyltransferase family 4 protein [Pseudomonadota bacterium]